MSLTLLRPDKSFEEIRKLIGQRTTDAPCCANCRWWDSEENERDYGCRSCLCAKTRFAREKPWLLTKGHEVCNFYEGGRSFEAEALRFKQEISSGGFRQTSTEEDGKVEIWERESREGSSKILEKVVISHEEGNASFELRVDNNGVFFTSYSGFSEDLFQGLSGLQKRKNSICLRKIGGRAGEDGSC